METRYIKYDYPEFISARKELLSSEINLINIISKINRYKMLRDNEQTFKKGIKEEIQNLKTKLKQIKSCFPEDEMKRIAQSHEKKAKKTKKQKREISISKTLEKELEDIRIKLKKLA